MNNKITFPELVDTIAELTNTSKRVSELFLKELFGVIKERLEQGETVKIKGLGTFKVTEIASRKSVNVNTGEEMEIPSHRRVSFTPDKSLAETINMPFDGFETVILDDNITDEELNELANVEPDETSDEILPPPFTADEKEEEERENTEVKEVTETQQPIDEEDVTNEPPVESDTDVAEQDVTDARETADFEIENNEVTELYSEGEDTQEDVQNEKRKSFVWGFLGGILACLLIGCVAIAVCESCFGDFVPSKILTRQNVEESNVQAIDSITVTPMVNVTTDSVEPSVVTPEKKPEIVVDTIRTNYYLTKMSRKYYGRYEFWVYIYLENRDKISNPNKVAPGLEVVIPPADKYDIDKDSPESVNKAKELAKKIL